MTTALFPGSFNPFTIGHADVARRALAFFDRLVIGVGVNTMKQKDVAVADRVQAIRRVFAGEGRIAVEAYEGLTVDYARQIGAQAIIKGVRSHKDFEYEMEQAIANRMLTGIETLLLPSDPALSAVSSTLVREIQRHGGDAGKFLPK